MLLINTTPTWYNVVTMYIRTVRARGIEYVQLAHNYRDADTGAVKARLLYNFGRKENLDYDSLRRLIKSIARFLPPEEVGAIQQQIGEEWPIEFLGSRQLGGAWFLNEMWERMGIGQTIRSILAKREYQNEIERMIFALVADRALAPSSKLHMQHWVAKEVYIPNLPEVEVHQLYRTMDFLLAANEEVQQKVFFHVANLFNLEVDILFLDTTTTYFEIEGEDGDKTYYDEETKKWIVDPGLRKRSQNSKDRRPDLAQVVIAFAVTRNGIPVRCWVWPGNTSDQSIVEEVKQDLNGWQLGRVVMVQDAGFNSEANRRTLQTAGGHYIIGEKLHQGPHAEPVEALMRGGRYKKMENDLEIKEVIVNGDSETRRRFVVVRNPAQARRDELKRDDIVKEANRRLTELKQLEGEPHRKEACKLRSHPVYGRYILQTDTGELQLDKAKIKAEALFDGKFLVSTSDDGLSAEDVVMGYKQLWEIERVFRDLKHLVDIRPVRHRLPERIRAHVLLCWLAMLIIRVTENEVEQTWFQLKKIFAELQLGMHRTPSGEIWQTNKATEEFKAVMDRLKLNLPPRYFRLPTTTKGGDA